MAEEFISYENLRIYPYEFQHIKDLKIENEINNHGILKVTGIIDDSLKDDYVLSTDEDTPIKVYYQKGDESISLFNGIVTKIRVNVIQEVYVMSIEAKSFTYMLDMYKEKRDFQNINMTTHELISEVMSSYKGAVYDTNIPNEPIGKFVLQYNETDYEFLKRIVSIYHQSIISDIKNDGIHLYLGIPDISIEPKKKIFNYTISKNIKEYNDVKNNDMPEILETDFIMYTIKTLEVFNTGEYFDFKGHDLYIKKSIYEIDEGNLKNIYELSPKGGIRSRRLYNMNVIGISINGSILKVQRDRVKVKLEISEEIDASTAYWFPYATVASSPDGGGWYCMPEVGERIRLNCPTKDESKAFIVNSIGTNKGKTGAEAENDRMSNPDIKSLKADSGQEVKFTPNGVNITSSGGKASVNLNNDGTVEITGQQNVNISCAQSLSLRAEEEMTICAKKSVDIQCESGSSLVMSEGDEILATGTRVANNG